MEAIKLVQAVSKTLWKHRHREMRMNAFFKIEKDLVHPRELCAIIMPESQYHIVRMTAAHNRDWAAEGLDSGRSELHSNSPWGLGGCRDMNAGYPRPYRPVKATNWDAEYACRVRRLFIVLRACISIFSQHL